MSSRSFTTAAENLSTPCSGGAARVVALLRAHVPLSLLLDLAGDDPRSEELYAREGAS